MGGGSVDVVPTSLIADVAARNEDGDGDNDQEDEGNGNDESCSEYSVEKTPSSFSVEMQPDAKGGSGPVSVQVPPLPLASEEGSEEQVGRRAMRKVSVRILPTVFFTGCLLMLDNSNISFIASLLLEDLGISKSGYGLLLSVYYGGQVIGQLPSSLLAKRMGMKRFMPLIFFLWAVIGLCTAASSSLGMLLALRALLGTLVAGLIPATQSYLGEFYGKSTIGRAWSVSFNLGTPVGSLIGGPLAALVLHITSGPGRWRWLFVVQSALFLVAAAPAYVILPSNPQSCGGFLTSREQQWMTDQAEEVQRDKRKRSSGLAAVTSQRQVLVGLLKDVRIILLACTRLLRTIGVYGMMYFTPLILGQGDRSLTTVALLVTLMLVFAIVGGQLWAISSDRRRERILHAAAGLLLMILGLAGTGLALQLHDPPSITMEVIFLLLARVGMYMFIIPFQAFQSDILPKHAAHLGFAIVSIAGALAGLCGPFIIGIIQTSFGFASSLYFMSATSTLAFASLLPLRYIQNTAGLIENDMCQSLDDPRSRSPEVGHAEDGCGGGGGGVSVHAETGCDTNDVN